MKPVGKGATFRSLVASLCTISLITGAPLPYIPQASPVPASSQAPPAAKIPPEQLDSLVAPIALYPDPLLAQTLAALRQVKANKGSAGIDRMAVGQLSDYLKQHWPFIREQLLNGTYEPKPVRRVEIPKPDGGMRKLGIPTVLDRLIQQAVMQVLQRRWDRTFSDSSYCFRPGRSAHHAVAQAQKYVAEGYGWCVDLDLEKFFDRVNHDKLMGRIFNAGHSRSPALNAFH